MDDAELKTLYEYRGQLIEIGLQQLGLFDKSLLALSTGSIGISILFLGSVTNSIDMRSLYILAISWFLLLATILLNLMSYYLSWSNNLKRVSLVDEAIKSGNSDPLYAIKDGELVKWVAIISIVTFAVGLIFLAIFALNSIGVT